MFYRNIIKPTFDFLAALLGLAITSPILLIITVLLFIKNSGKPFFFQARPGYKGKIFNIIKFKTMDDRRDKNGELLPDNIRLHRVGRIVRKLSFDELMQLVNVLKGDMSLIGPRPLLAEYLPLYNQEQARRHDVKPGITGWAQVNGRNTISWEQKFEYDVYYVDNQSFIIDLKIFFLTAKKVFGMSDINAGEEVTMEKFTGKHSN
jgi:lipopolysaccharide/colanic/teichoic acid biosynthesis glycosyltransferase